MYLSYASTSAPQIMCRYFDLYKHRYVAVLIIGTKVPREKLFFNKCM